MIVTIAFLFMLSFIVYATEIIDRISDHHDID